MSSSSKRRMSAPRNVPPPEGTKPAAAYSRFIPREELSSFSSWNPETLSGSTMRTGTGAPAEDPVPAAEVLAQQLTAARLNLRLTRAATVGDHPAFIAALADTVETALS